MEKHDVPWKDHFHVDTQQMERVLSAALTGGGHYADLYFEYRVSSTIRYEEQQVVHATRGISCGVGVRVVEGDRVGYAFSDGFSMEEMLRAASAASEIARSGGRVWSVNVSERRFPNRYPVAVLSTESDVSRKVGLLARADSEARRYDPRIAKVTAHFTENVRYLLFANSDGCLWRDVQPIVRFDVTAVAETSSGRQSGYHGGGGREGMEYFEAHPPEEHGRASARLAVLLLDAMDAPAGPQEVVLGCADSGILLHEAVGHGLEADFNRKALSNYAGRVGDTVASSLCTIVDSGLFPNMRGSINIDDEGTLPRENVLIDRGVLRGYMHDRLSAESMGVRPTGNGRRESYRHQPLPRMTNTFMLPGDHSREEIIASVDRGIYAKQFGGGEVDITKGDFVFSVNESYLIERGRVVAPLKNVSLIGNGPQIMNRVTMVGNDLEFSDGVWTCGKHGQRVPVGVGMPTIKISEITVGGTGR